MAVLSTIIAGLGLVHGIGKSAGWWGQPPKIKRSRLEKEYIESLRLQEKQGVYSPGTQQQMVSQAYGATESVAGRRRGEIRSDITAQGLENSMIAQMATKGIDRQQIQVIANIARQIAIENERSKATATTQLGQIGMSQTTQDYQNQLLKWQAKQGGFTQALGYASMLPGGGSEGKKPWGDATAADFSAMNDDQMSIFLKALSPEELLDFYKQLKLWDQAAKAGG